MKIDLKYLIAIFSFCAISVLFVVYLVIGCRQNDQNDRVVRDWNYGFGYSIGDNHYYSGELDSYMEFDEYVVGKQVVGNKPIDTKGYSRPSYPAGLNHTYYYIMNKFDNQGMGPLTYHDFIDSCNMLHLRLF